MQQAAKRIGLDRFLRHRYVFARDFGMGDAEGRFAVAVRYALQYFRRRGHALAEPGIGERHHGVAVQCFAGACQHIKRRNGSILHLVQAVEVTILTEMHHTETAFLQFNRY
jgi:hypothetical protein